MAVNLVFVVRELEKLFEKGDVKGYVLINGKPEVVIAKDTNVATRLAELLKDLPDKEKVIKLK